MTCYWLPTIPMTPVDLIHRHAAATGSVSYAMATADADYNGHTVSVSFKPHSIYGPVWNAEYWWGGRQVLARGSFDACVRAAVEEYRRGARGTTAYVSLEAEPTPEQHAGLERYGFQRWTEAIEQEHRATWWTGRHTAVQNAIDWARSGFGGLLQVALSFTGTPAEWPAARDAWLAEQREARRRAATGGRATCPFEQDWEAQAFLDDDEPEAPPEPQAWQRYDLVTEPDGPITGTASTNDNNDDGYPDGDVASWDVRYRDRAAMLRQTGGTHDGISGIHVTVVLDGEELDREGRPTHELPF